MDKVRADRMVTLNGRSLLVSIPVDKVRAEVGPGSVGARPLWFQSPWIRFAHENLAPDKGAEWRVSIPVDKVRAPIRVLSGAARRVSIPVDKVRANSPAQWRTAVQSFQSPWIRFAHKPICSAADCCTACFNPRG